MRQLKVELGLDLKSPLYSRKDLCNVKVFEKRKDGNFLLCKVLIVNGEVMILSPTGNYIPFVNLTEDTIFFHSIEAAELANLFQFIFEAIKWHEYWDSILPNLFVTELYL